MTKPLIYMRQIRPEEIKPGTFYFCFSEGGNRSHAKLVLKITKKNRILVYSFASKTLWDFDITSFNNCYVYDEK